MVSVPLKFMSLKKETDDKVSESVDREENLERK